MKKVHSSLFTVHRINKTVNCQLSTVNRRLLRPGFTLVELLIYMALLAIFLLTLTDILVSILDVRSESEATSSVEQDGRFIVSRLSYDINRANSVSAPLLGQTGSSLTISVGGISNTYSLSGGKLQLTSDLETNNLNGSETQISTISFQKIGNVGGKDTIKIQFTINSVTQRPSGPETRSFQTTAGLR